ncbi:MAG: hypothetical protein Q4D90_05450 [bacterium]|nr:hypothetical protein [bacterium]
MLILAIMAVGIVVGYLCFPIRWSRANAGLQLVCTAVLIFCMGVALGSRPNFWEELAELGIDSLIFSLLPIGLSVALVYVLTRKFMKRGEE